MWSKTEMLKFTSLQVFHSSVQNRGVLCYCLCTGNFWIVYNLTIFICILSKHRCPKLGKLKQKNLIEIHDISKIILSAMESFGGINIKLLNYFAQNPSQAYNL